MEVKVNKARRFSNRSTLLLAAGIFFLMLGGCGSDGDDGAPGAQGPPGPSGVPTTDLNLTITSASINSKPVVNFTATDQDGFPFTRLTLSDLRFTVAKLTPATLAGPSFWQNYIIRVEVPDPAVGPGGAAVLPLGAVQGNRESNGTLVNHNNGNYTYTYGTDVANLTCPINAADPITACADGTGKTIDLSFNASKTHRVGMQTRGSLPAVNATFDFVPAGGPVTVTRNMVRIEACNVCHDKLEAHDARIDVKYCVTCHNPGSTDANSGHIVDFKSMLHKLHYGAELPSFEDKGIPFVIWGYNNTAHDFSDIEFPPGVRSVSVGTPDLDPADPKFIPASTKGCTKCHNADDPRTPDASNFLTPNREACGACHDDISFAGVVPDPNDPNRTNLHGGGQQDDDTFCLLCHGPGAGPDLPGTVTKSHIIRARSAGACFQYNILQVAYAGEPTRVVTVDFSVTNSNPGTHPNPEAFDCPAQATYDILNDPEWTQLASRASRLVVDVGWNTADFGNALTPGSAPARTIELDALTTAIVSPTFAGAFQVSTADATVDPANALPPLATLCANATQAMPPQDCSGQVAVEGHPAVQGAVDMNGVLTGPYDVRVVVQGMVEGFSIDANPVLARREAVDVTTKCDRCHDVLSLHGSNRSDEGQLCVMCHNPNNTDISRRAGLMLPGRPAGQGIDGKFEESIDFKRMIHAIHAAERSSPTDPDRHGFRENGIVIYGYGGSEHDFSHVRFPGALWKCETCHLPDTYKLTDRTALGGANWEQPAQSGILGSTITSGGDNDPSNDQKISPTAAVCSACHDGAVAQSHMEDNGGLFGLPLGLTSVTQSDIDSNVEACAACHGPGKIASVEFVHSEGFGEDIP
jgi:OmcA/MtrC family decaheme c-type cytochrome